jgi:hypothetical protein
MQGELARGDVIAGRFRLDARAGEGGMGQVFRAEDLATGRVVALKFLVASDDGLRDRFAREAQTLASLAHPAIVGYVAHGLAEGGAPFLAMEWVEGVDLASALRGGPLSVPQTLALVRRLASALGVAHAQGVVHRDLKPGNVMLAGRVPAAATLVDFGIARPEGAFQAITRTGAIVGTCGYMAPEQVRGARDLDGRADLFALGCVAFECLTGRAPFGSDAFAAVLARVLLGEAPSVRELAPAVPPEVEAVVGRLLARERDARFPNAEALIEALDAIAMEGVSGTAPTVAARASLRPGPPLERTPVAVVLAWPPTDDPASDATVSEREVRSGEAATLPLAARWSGEFVPLAGGLVLLAFDRHQALQERVRRAARAALDLHGALPGWGVAVALSLGEQGARTASDRVLVGAYAGVTAHAPSSSRGGLSGVVVDASAASFLGSEFVVEVDGSVTLLTAYRAERDEARTVLGRTAPCFGRDKELRFIEGTLQECVDESAARTVILSAAPGLGKSRIRREFVARARERDEALVLTARADVGTSNATMGVVRAWLAESLGLQGGSPGERWERVASRGRAILARAVGASASTMVEFLGELADAPPPEPSTSLVDARSNARDMRQQLHAVLRAWLRGIALDRPLVLVLEDLHWADPSSVTMLAGVLSSIDDVPLLVLATSWPEAEHAHASLWSMKTTQVVRIEPLGRRASERVARLLLGDTIDAALVERVVELADGSPFLVEEVARHVGEGRSLDRLPSSAVAVVQARLATLPADLRRALRLAAVFGERFRLAGLEALSSSDTDPDAVASKLERLRREELVLSPDDDGGGDAAWSFRHSLVRRAAYEMLTEEDRRAAHGAAASWLSSRTDVEPAAVAEHFEHAHAFDAAARGYLKAIAEHEELGDYEAIGRLAERADRQEVDPALRAEAVYYSMFAMAFGERFERLAPTFARVDGDEFPRDCEGWAALKALSLSLKIHAGIPCDAQRELEAFFANAVTLEASFSRVFVLCLLVVSLLHVGLREDARRIARMIDAMVAREAVPSIVHAMRDAYVPWLMAVDDDPAALAAHRRAVTFALEKCNVPRQLEIIPPYIGFAMEFGCEAEARELLAFIGERRRGSGLPMDDFSLLGRVMIDVLGGTPRDCRAALSEQTNPEWRHVDLWLRAYALASPSVADPSSHERARESLAGLLALVEECGPMVSHRCSVLLLAAECALRLGDATKALALLDAIETAGSALLVDARTRSHLARVTALRALGRDAEAAEVLTAAKARLARVLDDLTPSDRASVASTPASRALLA